MTKDEYILFLEKENLSLTKKTLRLQSALLAISSGVISMHKLSSFITSVLKSLEKEPTNASNNDNQKHQ